MAVPLMGIAVKELLACLVKNRLMAGPARKQGSRLPGSKWGRLGSAAGRRKRIYGPERCQGARRPVRRHEKLIEHSTPWPVAERFRRQATIRACWNGVVQRIYCSGNARRVPDARKIQNSASRWNRAST